MNSSKCMGCGAYIEVTIEYRAEYCCDGQECGCYGRPINPLLCDDCEERAFGKRV